MVAINNIAKWLTVGLMAAHALACNFHKQPAATAAKGGGLPGNEPGNEPGPKEKKVQIPYYPLQSAQDLDWLLAQVGDARVVLLGEASHGTREYYLWRAALSKRLIQEKGFNFMAVEGEWADSYRVNNFVKGPRQDSTAAVQLLRHYNRWPTWMWGNHEVASLVKWLNTHNQQAASGQKVGFFGLDVYCVWESLADIVPHLEGRDAGAAQAARRAQQCFKPYSADAQQYALAVARADKTCWTETNRLWKAVEKLTGGAVPRDENLFVTQQHALVAANGEKYYRAMTTSNAESWNIRDRHMMETLRRLLELHGPRSKAIVWEHNTHVGDARYTDMASSAEVNVGQLARQQLGRENVFIVGFGSYQGSVIAADAWGAPIKQMPVPEAKAGSWEDMLHALGPTNKLVLSKDLQADPFFKRRIGQRAIGVVYNPRADRFENYVPSVIPQRYDAFIYLDQTTALHPLETPVKANEPPDLYPSGT
ncbi:erythromycin esterase family protein [Hymenobacter chitinivorans]|uniref:Erythromycin esterase-like protein n=1 Tax=Hymenobacter chitinivorans DSM 11115 TaxID=1121954 RepID=A0A2M9BS26_9BACT|nr:erythromycin esterase family protein [Hymenobacter chitinivorans]PJJ60731.1 erythromycin esterase-like protein [Hymenobacter chitinivorans DSM 11115]